MGHLPTTAQFNRLATLGVTDAERAMLSQRGFDRLYLHQVITTAVRYPLGSGGLRHYRLFGTFPGAARHIASLPDADRDAIRAWTHASVFGPFLEACFTVGNWSALAELGERADALADLARAGHADAARNACIEARIQDATVMLAGYATAAKAAGRIGVRDFEVYVAPLPERVRRAGRDWRSLAAGQRERAVYRRRLRYTVGFGA
jgi:hypothetical protein